MARTYRPVGESTAKEIAEFLLNKGITQAKIGATVDFIPTDKPPIILVAWPVPDCWIIELTGPLPIAV